MRNDSRNLGCIIQKPLSITGIEEVPNNSGVNLDDWLEGLTPEQLLKLRDNLGLSTRIEWKYLQ